MKLSEFKKIVADWPDNEDAEVWLETGWCCSDYVTSISRLNQYDILIRTNRFKIKESE